jgi:hypothetical protein
MVQLFSADSTLSRINSTLWPFPRSDLLDVVSWLIYFISRIITERVGKSLDRSAHRVRRGPSPKLMWLEDFHPEKAAAYPYFRSYLTLFLSAQTLVCADAHREMQLDGRSSPNCWVWRAGRNTRIIMSVLYLPFKLSVTALMRVRTNYTFDID